MLPILELECYLYRLAYWLLIPDIVKDRLRALESLRTYHVGSVFISNEANFGTKPRRIAFGSHYPMAIPVSLLCVDSILNVWLTRHQLPLSL